MSVGSIVAGVHSRDPSIDKTSGPIESLEIVKLDRVNYTLGYSAPVSRDVSTDKIESTANLHNKEIKFMKRRNSVASGPWVMARQTALKKNLKQKVNQDYENDESQKEIKKPKLDHNNVFKLNDNNQTKYVKKIAQLISSSGLLNIQQNNNDTKSRLSLKGKFRSSMNTPEKRQNENPGHYGTEARPMTKQSKNKGGYGILKNEPLNNIKHNACIGSTFPSLHYDCSLLKRNNLTDEEKRKWLQVTNQGKGYYQQLVQGDSKKEEIMENVKQLMRIHKTGDVSKKINFSTEVMKVTIEKKLNPWLNDKDAAKLFNDNSKSQNDPFVSDFDPRQAEAIKEYRMRKKSDTRFNMLVQKTDIKIPLGVRTVQTQPPSPRFESNAHNLFTKKDEVVSISTRWRLLRSFLLYVVRNGLTNLLEYTEDCQFFSKAYGLEGSSEIFQIIKRGNPESLKDLLKEKKKKLLLYCYDTVKPI